jgi:hypothetical protein
MKYTEKYIFEILLTIGILWKTGPVLNGNVELYCTGRKARMRIRKITFVAPYFIESIGVIFY